MTHSGSLEELKSIVEGTGHSIKSCEEKGSGYCIKTVSGAVCNWYPSTGTLLFQGKKDAKEKLEAGYADYTGAPAPRSVTAATEDPEAPSDPASANKKVFVVHGHDTHSREQLELVLHKLELDPFVLANTSGDGKTIIEALEHEIGPGGDRARFGIVLMTPDDSGYPKAGGADSVQPRALHNVVLEMGMLMAALGRPNVAILKKGHV